MAFISKLSNVLNLVIEKVVVVLTAVLTILTTTGVFYRYILGAPITWLYETTVVTFVWTVFLATSIAFKRGEHISLEFLVNGVSKKASRIVKIIITVLVMFFLIIVVREGFQIINDTATQKYQTINLSTAWFYASFPISAIISIVHLLKHVLDLIANKDEVIKNIEDRVIIE